MRDRVSAQWVRSVPVWTHLAITTQRFQSESSLQASVNVELCRPIVFVFLFLSSIIAIIFETQKLSKFIFWDITCSTKIRFVNAYLYPLN